MDYDTLMEEGAQHESVSLTQNELIVINSNDDLKCRVPETLIRM